MGHSKLDGGVGCVMTRFQTPAIVESLDRRRRSQLSEPSGRMSASSKVALDCRFVMPQEGFIVIKATLWQSIFHKTIDATWIVTKLLQRIDRTNKSIPKGGSASDVII